MRGGTHTAFREWLSSEITRQGVPRRELARRLAAKHPDGVTPQTIETYRRAIYRYLHPVKPVSPTAPTRAAIADALGVSLEEIPSADDEEDSELSALLLSLAAYLGRRGKTRELATVAQRIKEFA